MEIKNLKHDPLHVVRDGRSVVIPPSEPRPRVKWTPDEEDVLQVGEIEVPVTAKGSAYVTDLPDEEPGVMLVVELYVAEHATGRGDLLITGPAMKNEEGRYVTDSEGHLLIESFTRFSQS